MSSFVWLLGCHNISGSSDPTSDDLTDAVVSSDDDDDDDDDDDTTTEPVVRDLAGDIVISKVSMFQGVESVLVEDGQVPTTMEMPIVIGRPGWLRVFLAPEPGFDDRELTAVLDVISNDGTERIEHTKRITGPSRVEDPGSTFNFTLDSDLLIRTVEFHLEIVEVDDTGPGGGTRRKVVWDSEDLGGLDTDNTDELKIVIVPVRYDADGSGRLPDTSPAQLQRIEDLVMGVYPATNVVIEVDSPYPWSRGIGATSSSQWGDILDEMVSLRSRANEAPNTYYYGMFAPASSFGSYCSQGCIAGLSYLAYDPNEPALRASVGLGFTGDIASETLIHEVGHAHGRDHAPCGVSGDRDYPYPNARLGSWGYSVVTGELFPPNDYVDMMSYCSPLWISDYNLFSLFERMHDVAAQRIAAATPRTALRVIDGVATPMPPISLSGSGGGLRAEVELFDASGTPAGRAGAAWFPYDHIDGGMIALDDELPQGWTAQVISLPAR